MEKWSRNDRQKKHIGVPTMRSVIALGFLVFISGITLAQDPRYSVPVASPSQDFSVIGRSNNTLPSHKELLGGDPLDWADVRMFPTSNHQFEMSVAVSPGNRYQALVAANTFLYDSQGNLIDQSVGVYWSVNGGQAWAGTDQIPGGPRPLGDPAAAIGRRLNGPDYYYVGFISSGQGQGIARSVNGGQTWTRHTVAPGGLGLLDKNHLAVDNNPTSPFFGRLYSAWTKFGTPMPKIELKYSLDAGSTWVAPASGLVISSDVNAGNRDQGVNIQIGPNGEVYAVWAIYDSDFEGIFNREDAIGFSKSIDGGANWSPAVRIKSIKGFRCRDLIPVLRIRTNSYPAMAVSQSTGALYVIWIEDVGENDTNVDPDVFMIKSTDGGSTWNALGSTPKRVNDDAADHYQLFPWISVDALTDYINVIFYDGRDYLIPSNSFRVTVGQSTDGGSTFNNYRISDSDFDISALQNASFQHGDYIGIASLGGYTYGVWNDQREPGTPPRSQGWASALLNNVTIIAQEPDGQSGFSVDSVGHWEENSGFVQHKAPWTTTELEPFSSQVLRATQKTLPVVGGTNQKYVSWSIDPNILNHRSFFIGDADVRITANLAPIYNGIIIKNELNGIDIGGTIDFRDPWFIDFADPIYQGNLRNSGPVEAQWYSRPSPFQLSSFPAYQGVFLNQSPSGPHYSIRTAPARKVGSFPAVFNQWSSTGGHVECVTCPETSVVFTASNAVVRAQYKYQFQSLSASTTTYNNQRKLAVSFPEYASLPEAIHLVYDSSNVVKYFASTDNGTTWGQEQTFFGDDMGRGPVIDISNRYEEEHPMIIFENRFSEYPENFQFYGAVRRYRNGNDPPGPPLIWSGFYLFGSEQYEGIPYSKPVLAFPFLFFRRASYPTTEYYVGLSSYLTVAGDPGDAPFINSPVRVPLDMSNTADNLSAARALYHGPFSNSLRVDTIHVAWEENNSIRYRKVLGGGQSSTLWGNNETVAFDKSVVATHGKPTITVDYLGRPSVAWECQPSGFSKQIRQRRREYTGWGVTNSFSSFGITYSQPSISRHATTLTSNNLALSWSTSLSTVRTVRLIGSSWEDQGAISDQGGFPTGIGYQRTGPQLFAFTGYTYSDPIGVTTYPAVGPPSDPNIELSHESYRELELSSDDATVSLGLGSIVISIPDSTGPLERRRHRVGFRALADTATIPDFASLERGLVSKPFDAPAGTEVSAFLWTKVHAPDSLTRWSRGSKLVLGVCLINATSGELIQQIGLYTIERRSMPSFRGKLRYTFARQESNLRLAIKLAQTGGGMGWTTNLLVHHVDGLMPDDTSNDFLVARTVQRPLTPETLPTVNVLYQNHPNPFNPSTQLNFDLPKAGNVSLVIYDILGRQIVELVNGNREAGNHSAIWNAADHASGIYLARFSVVDGSGRQVYSKINKLVLMK